MKNLVIAVYVRLRTTNNIWNYLFGTLFAYLGVDNVCSYWCGEIPGIILFPKLIHLFPLFDRRCKVAIYKVGLSWVNLLGEIGWSGRVGAQLQSLDVNNGQGCSQRGAFLKCQFEFVLQVVEIVGQGILEY